MNVTKEQAQRIVRIVVPVSFTSIGVIFDYPKKLYIPIVFFEIATL